MISIVALVIGVLIFCTGIYYLRKEKEDPESKKIYAIAALAGAVIAIGAAVKLLLAG